MSEQLRATPLADFHVRHRATMGDFAGWSMPLKYAGGGLAEHRHTRAAATLFDVSHMCQLRVTGANREQALDRVLPIASAKLKQDRNKYSFVLNAAGGVIDDLIIGNEGAEHLIVCNASRAEAVIAHLAAEFGDDASVERITDRALLAVQGPGSGALVGEIFPFADELYFMDSGHGDFDGHACRLCRCGYTGEDGFEIAVPATVASALSERLVADPAKCIPAGLLARDSLRLEACLCLYGNDLNESISPLEADLRWAIAPSVRAAATYLGAAKVTEQLEQGCSRLSVALQIEGKSLLRQGAELRKDGKAVGEVTSGGFSPTQGKPIAMCMVAIEHAEVGTQLQAEVRGREIACEVTAKPFVQHNYRVRPRKK